ncbi:MAG: MBL fold metallo-hydrolase [Candidatus Aadella gelida]|nr:MBL fold metallo-hydrolase [Candidatus Aadella gelida]
MNIKILYDNTKIGNKICAGWGFSCLVGDSVLFDTGEDGKNLLNNMRQMKVKLSDIKDVVISHDHWDHTGGLEAVLKNKITVYGCKTFSSAFQTIVKKSGSELINLELFSNVSGNVFSTGAIQTTYKGAKFEEQSLVLRTTNGLSIITGCAHPGIVKIVERVKKLFPQETLYSVLGGFHLKGMSVKEINKVCDHLKDLDVQKTGPSHCSGERAINIFEKRFGMNFIQVSAGKQLEV